MADGLRRRRREAAGGGAGAAAAGRRAGRAWLRPGEARTAGEAAVALFALAVFAGSVGGGFVFDDRFALLDNGDTRPGGAPLWDVLTRHDFWGQRLDSDSTHRSYRPVPVLLWRAMRCAAEALLGAGRNPPMPFHLLNVVLHAANAVMLLRLARRLGLPERAALLAALAFAAHPVHAENVASVVGGADVLAAACCLGAALLWGRARAAPALALLALGTLTKETAVTAAAPLLVADALLLPRPVQLRDLARRAAALGSVGVAYAALRVSLMGGLARAVQVGQQVIRPVENVVLAAGPPGSPGRPLTASYLHYRYARLLVWPAGLCCDYSARCVEPVLDAGDPRSLLGLATYACVLACAAVAWRRRSVPALVGLVWLLAPFLPAANIVSYVGTTVAERVLYLPSVGFCLLLGAAASALPAFAGADGDGDGDDAGASDAAAKKDDDAAAARPAASTTRRRRRGVRSTLAAAAAALVWAGAHAASRGGDWHTDETLFRSALGVCPDGVKVLQNFGILHRREMEWDDALDKFRRALGDDDGELFCEPHYWIGLTLVSRDPSRRGVDQAFRHLRRAASSCKWMAGQAVVALNNLQKDRMRLARGPRAESRAVREWASVLEELGMREDAARHYEDAGAGLGTAGDAAGCRDAMLGSARLGWSGGRSAAERCVARVWLGRCAVDAGLGDGEGALEAIRALRDVVEDTACSADTRTVAANTLAVIPAAGAHAAAVHEAHAAVLRAAGRPSPQDGDEEEEEEEEDEEDDEDEAGDEDKAAGLDRIDGAASPDEVRQSGLDVASRLLVAAYLHTEKGDAARAAENFRAAAAAAPRHAEVVYRAGVGLVELGDSHGGAELIVRAGRLAGDSEVGTMAAEAVEQLRRAGVLP